MESGQDRSAPLWQKLTYAVYLRVAISIVSGLALIAAAIALNGAQNEDNSAAAAEEAGSWSFQRETFAVSGTLIAATGTTIIVQTVFILVTKWGPYIYQPGDNMHLCIQTVDFITSFALLQGTIAGTVASGVVAYQWKSTSDGPSHSDTQDSLYKPVSGSAAFGFLSAVLLTVLCVWNSYTICLPKTTFCSRSSRRKLSSSVTPV